MKHKFMMAGAFVMALLTVTIIRYRVICEKAFYWAQLHKLSQQVLALEKTGQNTLCARQILTETDWLLDSTHDVHRVAEHVQTLRDVLKNLPAANADDEQSETDGSWGACYTEWFFKLDASFDHISELDDKHQVPKYPVRFLDCINSPELLTNHLNDLLISDLDADGVDRGRELNETIADLLRLVIHHEPADYPFHPQLKQAFLDFLMNKARNPETGYWGPWYRKGNQIEKTLGLSLTFHIISYLKGDITDWPKVIDTTLAIKDKLYPHGWLTRHGYSNHHNMDVVVLFRYGWKYAAPAQQAIIRAEFHKMLDWSLKKSLQPDGSFLVYGDDSQEDAEYFGTAFLARLGYFDRAKRFWTDESFPEAPKVKERIAAFIHTHLNSGGEGGSYYRDALTVELGEPLP